MNVEELVGKELCGYRLTSWLGEGGMAVVYRGENVLDAQSVRALKVIRPALLGLHRELKARFIEEARVLETLNHPNIVRFYKLSRQDGLLVMELELLKGHTLAAVSHPVSLTDAVEWIRQSAEGVSAAHAKGIIHRDLKPENLFLTSHGVVKVLDFGIARIADASLRERMRTTGHDRRGPGTLAYAAPEIIRNQKPNTATDVYALGLTLYTLLAGHHPFFPHGEEGVSEYEVMQRHVNGDIPDIRTLRPDVRSELAQIIAKALSKDPQSRFSDAAALSYALQAPTDSIPSTTSLPTQPSETYLEVPQFESTHFEIPQFEEISGSEDLDSPAESGDDVISTGERTGRGAALHHGSSSGDTVSPLRKRMWGWRLVAIVGVVFLVSGVALLFNYHFGDVDYPMVQISAGTFEMGSPSSEQGRDDDEAQHMVRLTHDFFLGSMEVTQGLWRNVMGSNPASGKDYKGVSLSGDALPVVYVSWFDAVRFANALSDRDGLERCYAISGETVRWPKGLDCKGYRLPTEAEWEYAARAGSSQILAGTSSYTDICAYGNVSDLAAKERFGRNSDWSQQCRDQHIGLAPVGSYRPNDWNLYDMSGNVSEWCWDWHGDYPSGTNLDPLGSGAGSLRVYRGGAWGRYPRRARVAYRDRLPPSNAYRYLGLRLARSL